MNDRMPWFLVVVVVLVIFGSLIYAAVLLYGDESDRNRCVAEHNVCVSTTDGWLPYE